MTKQTYFSSEHVSPGHPDKVMDAIAESVVDYQVDRGAARTAVDGCCKNNMVVLVGECSDYESIPFQDLATSVVRYIGYNTKNSPSFNSENMELIPVFTGQSADIAAGTNDVAKGAGDIGIMFGGAVKEAPDFTCHSHYLAREISHKIYMLTFKNPQICPDQKTQVTVKYEDGVATSVTDVVCCVSHMPEFSTTYVEQICKAIVDDILAEYHKETGLEFEGYKLHVNPTGAFSIFGPAADSGEVGRKIVCDQFGGYFAVGGGNLNGKDATKVDRSAVYMCRYVSKLVVSLGYATKCQIQVSYAIGEKRPISINVETYGTELVEKEKIQSFVDGYDFSPESIISRFKLNDPDRGFKYVDLGMYGHIGKRFNQNIELPWESI